MFVTVALSAQAVTDAQGPKNEEIPEFRLYPNPVSEGVVYMASKENGTKTVVVYDVFGKEVLAERITNNVLHITSLVPGVYVLQVAEGKKTVTRKLVVK